VINASRAIRFVPQSKVSYRITPVSRLSYIGRSNKKMEAQFLGMKLQMGYLRAREDSPRVRAACINYLQTWLPHFYPNRPDLVAEATEIARSLGATLQVPKASWTHARIERLFGFGAAKHVRLYYNQLKSYALRAWDKTMFALEGRRSFAGLKDVAFRKPTISKSCERGSRAPSIRSGLLIGLGD